MPLRIVRDDLVNMKVDAIVLPSNEKLAVDGGTGGAVAKKAGLLRVRRACRKIGGCPVGSAVSTPAFSFPAKFHMSRQHFSKIRGNVGYHPSKATVLALCVALELDLSQTAIFFPAPDSRCHMPASSTSWSNTS